MSNVQEALKAAIEWLEEMYGEEERKQALELCKAALSEIEKCEPVKGVVIREGLPTLLSDKYIKATDIRLYTSPQPRDWVVPSNEVIDTLWHKATHESVAHSEPFTRYRFSELLIKQLNTKG